jgi:hypothetical protein
MDQVERDPYTGDRVVVRRSHTGLIIGVIILLAIVAAVVFGLVDVRQTKDAKLPEVSVSGGQAPAYDVKTADVDVGTKSTSVDVPKVSVDTTKKSIEVPTVSVHKAN